MFPYYADVRDFVLRYVWKKAGPFGGLRVLKDDGVVEGDCRNFALTVAWLMAGRSIVVMLLNIIVGNSVLWFCWAKGPHMALWDNGSGWICSSHRDWLKRTPNTRLLPLQPVFLALLILIAWFFGG